MRRDAISPALGFRAVQGSSRRAARQSVRMLGLTLGLALLAAPLPAEIQFQEVTTAAGISYIGPSWGAFWGDLNGDGWPDLFVGNHYAEIPSLYLNQGDGTFADVVGSVSPDLMEGADRHNAVWVDFDGDGDQDLHIMTGAERGVGSEPDYLLVNHLGFLDDAGFAWGLENEAGRGRAPLWFDADGDSRLDVLACCAVREDGLAPTTLYLRSGDAFSDGSSMAGIQFDEDVLGYIYSSITGDPRPEIILLDEHFPRYVFDPSTLPFQDLAAWLPVPSLIRVSDAISADFDGDLRPDLVLSTYTYKSETAVLGSLLLDVSLNLSNPGEAGVDFKTSGPIQVNIWNRLPVDSIFIGAGAVQPPDQIFDLDGADSAAWGMPAHQPGIDSGMFLGFDPAGGVWEFRFSCPEADGIKFRICAQEQISELVEIGFAPFQSGDSLHLLQQQEIGFSDRSLEAGLALPLSARGLAAGDFDNDMDLDLYIVSASPARNRPNLLYENDGLGCFSPVTSAGQAEGTSIGRGNSAVVADFDRDGFLDLFVTNGYGHEPFHDGPDQLFRNLGNGNHWLESELEGVVSNRDGIGAWALWTSGGKTQLRESSGGMHGRSQDFKRLHFGLGANGQAELIEVHWPSGVVQKLWNVPAGQILRIVEALSPGDLNGDFAIDVQDALILADYLAGNLDPGTGGFTAPVSAADMDGNSTVNALDLLHLMLAR